MQLKYIYIILLSLTFLSCQDKIKATRYYPFKELYNDSNFIKIDLDTTTFQALTPTQQTEYSTIVSDEEHGNEQAKGSTCD